MTFEEEMISHRKLLLGLAMKRCRNQSNAEDLVQETFLLALRYKDKFVAGTNMRAWLCTILKNRHMTIRRRKHNHYEIVDTEWLEACSVTIPEEATTKLILADMIEEMRFRLTPEMLKVFIPYVSGEPLEDIAREAGVAVGTIKSRIHRARNALGIKG